MYKKIAFAFSVCLYAGYGYAQTTDIEKVLLEVEENNRELQAYSSLMQSNKLELKSGNNLPDPQLGGYYLPFGDHNGGDYSEFQVTQSFEFPTVYGARKGLIGLKQDGLQLEYAAKRQEVLLLAIQYCYELLFLNKKLTVEQQRIVQAKKVYDQVNELFEKEQVGILELNKAKVSWMQEQFKVEQIKSDRQSALLQLETLNGGKEITFDQTEYVADLDLPSSGSLWEQKMTSDPVLKNLKQQEAVALQAIKLSKSKSLPNLTAGFNTQGISGAYYSGLYAGLSIPLWSSKNRVKAAESYLEYQQAFSSAASASTHAAFEKDYHDYQVLYAKYREYAATLEGLYSDTLLLKAYELGEISFIEYYMELLFYREAYNDMLNMEKQLYQLKAKLLKHQL